MSFLPKAHPCDHLKEAKDLKIEHAKFLKIKEYKSGYFLEVLNSSGSVSNIYSSNINHQCENVVKIKKTDRVGTFSTTHYLPIMMLGESKRLKGVSGKKYLYFNGGKESLIEMGERPSIERIIKGNFDLIFGYSLKNNSKDIFYQLDKFNVPSINVLDYLEPSPLGRAEWIKMFGAIFNKYNKSEKIFREIKKSYQEIIFKNNYKGKISVVVAQEYQGSWFVPGNKSYIKKMLSDLGVKVLPVVDSDNRLKVSREIILSSLRKADFWFPQSNQKSKKIFLNSLD